jgi:hypothetical protein
MEYHIPYWLTGRGIDEIVEEDYDVCNMVREEFMQIGAEEEQKIGADKKHDTTIAKVMNDAWDSKGVWFWHCLDSVNAMYFLLESHISPKFLGIPSRGTEETIAQFWYPRAQDIVSQKVSEKQRYDEELRYLFFGEGEAAKSEE